MKRDDWNEKSVADALVDCKGDLIQAADSLRMRYWRLNQILRYNPTLRALAVEIVKVKSDPSYDTMSREQFAAELSSRTQAYQLEGLEVIHELATTDHAGSAALADVRLKAAVQLRGSGIESQSGLAGIMAELNERYLESATRIKGLRATATVSLTLEQGTHQAVPVPTLPAE